MTTIDILNQQYSFKFDALRKDRMVMGYYKYGPIKENLVNNLVDIIATLEMRLEMYKKSGNTEYLCDIANFAMMEFMYPQHPNAHFETTDSNARHIVGMSTRELEEWNKS